MSNKLNNDAYAALITPLVPEVINELLAIGLPEEAEQLGLRQQYGYCIASGYNRAINLIVTHYINSEVLNRHMDAVDEPSTLSIDIPVLPFHEGQFDEAVESQDPTGLALKLRKGVESVLSDLSDRAFLMIRDAPEVRVLMINKDNLNSTFEYGDWQPAPRYEFLQCTTFRDDIPLSHYWLDVVIKHPDAQSINRSRSSSVIAG
jgi:hypothetical protein